MARWSCGLRDGSFEPQLRVAGNRGGLTEMDNAVEGLAYGMSRFIIEFGDRLDGHF